MFRALSAAVLVAAVAACAPAPTATGAGGAPMYRVDPAGTGSITPLGTFPTDNTGGTSTSVMFAPGRILQVGGGNANAASRNASIIDINGASPQVTALPQAQFGRHDTQQVIFEWHDVHDRERASRIYKDFELAAVGFPVQFHRNGAVVERTEGHGF